MKAVGFIFTFGSIIAIVLSITFAVIAKYKYRNEYSYSWELADRSSTIEEKSKHINTFVSKLENSGLNGKHNALFMETPTNGFDANLTALKSLQQRLNDIKGMNPSSFEYQTAIQQITQQEQGEADVMLSVFKGIWFKEHYPMIWDWICMFQVIFCFLLLVAGIGIISTEYDWYF